MCAPSITEPLTRVSSQLAGRRPGARLALAAILTASVLLEGAPSAAPALGRIEGVVRLVAPPDAPITSGAYPTRRVSRPAPNAAEIANVIVFLRFDKDAARSASLPTTRQQMMQRDESFVPRVLAVTKGSTVEFPNSDPYFHNVFSLSRGAAFDLGRFPRGESRARTFTRTGLIKVYCHLHSHMSASIMVFDHPHFAIPRTDGHFALDGVPAGSYQLSAWHERIGESAKPITVEAGRIARVEFALPVEAR
jgi:plastocyanin